MSSVYFRSQYSKPINDSFCIFSNTISRSAQKIFDAVKNFFLFPSRYFGSKTWSIPGVLFRTLTGKPLSIKQTGYTYKTEKLPSPAQYLLHAAAAHYVHHTSENWILPFGYKPIEPLSLSIETKKIEQRKQCFFNPESGLNISVIEKGDEILIIPGALDAGKKEVNWDRQKHEKIQRKLQTASVLNWVGGVPDIYLEAFSLSSELLAHPYFQNKKITFVGSSFGGSIASFLALKHRLPGVSINGLQLGVGLQKEIGNETLRNADKYLTQISVKNDLLTDLKIMDIADRFFSAIGIKTPGNFGRKYTIETPYLSWKKTHCDIFGNFLYNLGLDTSIQPKELPISLLENTIP